MDCEIRSAARLIRPAESSSLTTSGRMNTKRSFKDERGRTMVGRRQMGSDPTAAPQITLAPASQLVAVGSTVAFTASASGAQPLTYQWQRNGQNIPNSNAPTYTLSSVSATDNGAAFDVIVTNAFGHA